MKNDPNGQFELTPDLFEGMSGDTTFLKNGVQKILDGDTSVRHGVCIPIAAAILDARDMQDGKNGDVAAGIDHIISELTIFKNNLDF